MWKVVEQTLQNVESTLYGQQRMWQWWLLVVVLITLGLYQLCKALAFAIKIAIRESRYSPSMYEWYGHESKESYVVVTGGSDGIGF